MALLVAAGIAVAATPLLGRLGVAVGLVDRPGDLKIHRRPVPLTGGVAALAGAAAGMAARGGVLDWGVAVGVGVALAGGLADDARPLHPWARVLLQGAAGAAIVMWSSLVGDGPVAAAGVPVLVLATANAVNITDGQDGLAGGVAAVAALGLAAVGVVGGDPVGTAAGLALAGGLAGFLLWNLPPARVFLGNGGAYGVGCLLAVLAGRAAALHGLRGLLAAGACLGVFAFELVFTVLRRMRSREPLASGDRGHSYDLVAARMGRSPSTLVFVGLQVVAAGLGILVVRLPLGFGAVAMALAAAAAGAWGVWLWSGHSRLPRTT